MTSALNGGKWAPSCPDLFIPKERGPSTHLIGSWVGHRAGLDNMTKRKVLTLRGLELWPLSHLAHAQLPYWKFTRDKFPVYKYSLRISRKYYRTRFEVMNMNFECSLLWCEYKCNTAITVFTCGFYKLYHSKIVFIVFNYKLAYESIITHSSEICIILNVFAPQISLS